MDELKSCPYCGSEDVEEVYSTVQGCANLTQSGYVACHNCGTCGPEIEASDDDGKGGLDTIAERVRAEWNKRNPSPPDIPDELNEDFRAGTKAMFDYVKYRAANSYHGDPTIQKHIDIENEIAERWIEEALDGVDEFAYDQWKSIIELESEKHQLLLKIVDLQQKVLRLMDI